MSDQSLPASSTQAVLARIWAAGAETPGSPPPHLPQSRNQSQTDGLAVGAVPSGLAAVAAALAGTQKTMTGALSAVETGELEGLAPGAEDPTPGAQTPAGLAPGAAL